MVQFDSTTFLCRGRPLCLPLFSGDHGGSPLQNFIKLNHYPILHQVDSSETRLYGGVGLGLYIVKNFTELLGGKVDVESEEEKGATFTVTLPARSAAPSGA